MDTCISFSPGWTPQMLLSSPSYSLKMGGLRLCKPRLFEQLSLLHHMWPLRVLLHYIFWSFHYLPKFWLTSNHWPLRHPQPQLTPFFLNHSSDFPRFLLLFFWRPFYFIGYLISTPRIELGLIVDFCSKRIKLPKWNMQEHTAHCEKNFYRYK